MPTLDIVRYPARVLRQRAAEVEDVDGALASLLDAMAETMYEARGIGLAAPQVARSLRAIVVHVRGDDVPDSGLLQLVNPRIVEAHGQTLSEEGCLSFPGLSVEVPRHTEVLVHAVGRDGHPVAIEADGLLAICLQHEIDHLEGITFVDRLKGLRRRLALRRYYIELERASEQGEAA